MLHTFQIQSPLTPYTVFHVSLRAASFTDCISADKVNMDCSIPNICLQVDENVPKVGGHNQLILYGFQCPKTDYTLVACLNQVWGKTM